jgi:hypothetical protein
MFMVCVECFAVVKESCLIGDPVVPITCPACESRGRKRLRKALLREGDGGGSPERRAGGSAVPVPSEGAPNVLPLHRP